MSAPEQEILQEAARPAWQRWTEVEEHRRICQWRLAGLVEVREPVALVSQVQRSGGTLLSQLFDGHPECHAHPSEIQIGHPEKWDWPPIDLDRPESWFPTLYEERAAKHFVRGYRKSRHGGVVDVLPFLFLPSLQKALFDACVASRSIERERDVLDCYFTSYFNAWLDNQNLYAGPKKVVTGFTPRLATVPGNLERFFAAYPEGTILSIVRDPCGWYASARSHRGHEREYRDLDAAIGLWRASAEAALEGRAQYGDRVVVLTYEQLVSTNEATMRRVAERIGISWSPALLQPTFNARPIRANSSYSVERFGILGDRPEYYRELLDGETIERIEVLAGDLYERAAAAGEAL